ELPPYFRHQTARGTTYELLRRPGLRKNWQTSKDGSYACPGKSIPVWRGPPVRAAVREFRFELVSLGAAYASKSKSEVTAAPTEQEPVGPKQGSEQSAR